MTSSAILRRVEEKNAPQSKPVKSGIYRGIVDHQRTQPIVNAFRYQVFMMYLDLDELPELFDRFWLWSAESGNVACFRRSDHFGSADQRLKDAVADLVEQQLGFRPTGPVRMLTNLRYWGFIMNPVSFYYCYDDCEQLVAFVAEVHNTPWGETHCYVLPWENALAEKKGAEAEEISSIPGESRLLTAEHKKAFHVSPFLPMQMCYRWQATAPGRDLTVQIFNHTEAGSPFSARLELQRFELTAGQLAWTLLNFPWMTAKVITAIYWQALKLWFRGAVYYPHP